GEWKLGGTPKKYREFGDDYTRSGTGTITYSDTKHFDGTTAQWHHVEDSTIHTTQTGRRYVDRSTPGQVDGLIRMDSGELASKLTGQGLVGDYTLVGDSTSKLILDETAHLAAGTVDRHRTIDSKSTQHQEGGHATFSFEQDQEVESFTETSNALI